MVLDGKNGPHGIYQELVKRGLPAHIFVAGGDGVHVHNPFIKGNDYSESYRDGEIKCIENLHKSKGVAAVVAVYTSHNTIEELSDVIKKINAIDPGIKVITAGIGSEELQEMKELGAIISASVDNYNNDKLIEETIRKQIPSLSKTR